MRQAHLFAPPWLAIRAHWPCQAGFTLLEIMLAVAVFAIALLGMSSMQIMSIRLNTAAQLKTEIAAVGQEHMEDLLAQPYTAAVLADPAPLGQPTTYCVLYPNEGLSPCRVCVPPATCPIPSQPIAPPYCEIVSQAANGNECTDAVFAPPTAGYKVWWSVDKNSNDSMLYINLSVSHKEPGGRIRSVALSFAKNAFN